MADLIRHARAVSPYFYPNKGGAASNLHGITKIGTKGSQNGTDVFVVGKKVKCGTDKAIPETAVPITQLERGEIVSYLTLANLAVEPAEGLNLEDFSDALVDVALFERDSFAGTIEQTYWYPKTAIDSLAINIADPDAKIERTINLSGDTEKQLNYSNKYLIHKQDTVGTGVDGTHDIVVSDPVPQADPNVSGGYILRIDRTRAGVTASITTYTYNSGTTTITITDALTGDVYNIYYSSDSFGSAGDPTTVDVGNPCFLKASYVKVLISDGVNESELDILSSLSIDASLNRIDEGVIGNDEKIFREISDTPVKVSLTGRVKDSTFAEAFMQKLTESHGITDISLFQDVVRITVLIYSDATKTTFLMGYQVDDISFADDSTDFSANEFGTISLNGNSTDMLISTDIANFNLI